MSKTIIEIDSFNPYESILPNRKVVTREVLNLIKTLRSEGYEVIIKPKNNIPLEYLFKKGESTFLSDPAIQIVISIPLTIITTLITNWIQKLIDNEKNESNNVIIINNETNTITNSGEKVITTSQLKDKKKKSSAIKAKFEKCLKTKSPFSKLPFPILLNHKPKIVGWCSLLETEDGLEIENGIIIDQNVLRKLKKSKFKGASVTGIAKKSLCSICNTDYIKCNHISGQVYSGKNCSNIILEADLVEVSIVKKPINEKALIKLIH